MTYSLAQLYTFFLKAHILAGQVRPNGQNVTDFAWLTKQELEECVCRSVKNIPIYDMVFLTSLRSAIGPSRPFPAQPHSLLRRRFPRLPLNSSARSSRV